MGNQVLVLYGQASFMEKLVIKFLPILAAETLSHKHLFGVGQSLDTDGEGSWVHNCHDLGDSILWSSPESSLSEQGLFIIIFGETDSQDAADSWIVLDLEIEDKRSFTLSFQIKIANINHGCGR
jgi:hypothetical protein